jgi:hypothetical protein
LSSGATNTGLSNDFSFYDIVNAKWISLRPNLAFPQTRSFHTVTIIALNLIIFGGQDQEANILQDLWIASLIPSADLSSIQDLVWIPAPVVSTNRPAGRIHHTTQGANAVVRYLL